MRDEIAQFLATTYPVIKSRYPTEGRRRWLLRALQEFWASGSQSSPTTTQKPASHQDGLIQDGDPLDHLTDGREPGLLLRTDYSNEDAWGIFCTKLGDAEKEFTEAMKPDGTESKESSSIQPPSKSDDVKMEDTEGDSDSDSDSDSSTEGIPFPIIKIINPTVPGDRAVFNGVSNLGALRLLNDVDVRPSPTPPAGTKRINPPNRLIDQGGWQEIYSGTSIWIYDVASNTDQCVRLVGQEGDVYGTATGDSWRARVTHICELQFNMSYLGMKIDFGGLDRWDYSERRRNLDEANMDIA